MATASFRTLSPNSNAYRSTSTFSSLKIARTVTEKSAKKNKKIHLSERKHECKTG